LVLGFFRVQAKYSVRGRRADTLPVLIRLNMMTVEERAEAYRQLSREHMAANARDVMHVKSILTK
jgi:hypothetical protein